MMRPRSPLRYVALLPVFLLVLSACSVSGDKTSLTLPGTRGPLISPFITGLYPTGGKDSELAQYLNWFRSIDAPRADSVSDAILDPSCPLEYDYASMSTSSPNVGVWGDGTDGLRIADVNVNGMTGFYNTARMEVLFLLRGHTFAQDGTNHHCDDIKDASLAAYVPVRLNLSSGEWELDGWASPASTIVVSVAQGFPMVPVKNDTELADQHSIVSPFRLMRFQITPENFDRVVSFATLNDEHQGYSRKILWFRESDVSPSYEHLAAGTNCLPGAIAFWDVNHDPKPCGQGVDLSDSSLSTWDDRLARMTGTDDVVGTSEDDNSIFGGGGPSTVPWSTIRDDLTKLVQKDQSYADALGQLRKDLRAYDGIAHTNLESDFAPPDEFGGWDHTDQGLFAIISAGGKRAMDDVKDALCGCNRILLVESTQAGGGNSGLLGFVGDPQGFLNTSNTGFVNTVTLSPSFSYASVKTDESAAAFYDKYSLLLNDGQKAFNVMSFSTSGTGAAGASLPYAQSPLAQITIKVNDSFNAGNASTYVSNWIPVMAVERNTADAKRVSKNLDLLGNFGDAVFGAISDLMYGIYRATVGGWLSGLAQAATGNLLAVPSLDPYQTSYIRGDGTPAYVVNRELVHEALAKKNLIHFRPAADGLSGNEATCTTAAYAGQLSDPNNVIQVGGKDFPVGVCFQQNGTYALFNTVRGFSLLLVILLMGRYFLALMSGGAEKRKFGLTAFFARCIFVFALILGMDVVLRVMAGVVAETVLVTNILGTQAGSGTPYSHLWLFSAYLNSPSREVSIFALVIMSPFLLLGLFILLLSNWLRFGMTYFVVGVSPLWVISLLSSARPAFFYRSLLWMFRLYLVPLLSLVVILVLFIVIHMLGIDPNGAGLAEVVVGMILLIAVAVLPWILAKTLINMVRAPIQAVIDGALASIESHSGNVALEAIGSGTSEAQAAAAQERRLEAFTLPELQNKGVDAAGASVPAADLGAGLSPVAGGDTGPASAARLGYAGAETPQGAWGAPPGTYSVPGGVPGLGAGDTGQLAGINTPPAASPEALAAGANALALSGAPQLGEGPDLARRSLKMRVLRGAGRMALGAAFTGVTDFRNEALDMRPAFDKDGKPILGPDGKQLKTPGGKPRLLAFAEDGKPILGADGKQLMTIDGKAPPKLGARLKSYATHDNFITGLSYLTGTAMVSDGFDPDSRTGRALASLDKGTRSLASFTDDSRKRVAGVTPMLGRVLRHTPEIATALADHQAAIAWLQTGAQDVATKRARSVEIATLDPSNDPAAAGARRDVAEAEKALNERQTKARAAWQKLADTNYQAPLVGNGQHVARDQMAFEQARNAALLNLIEANDYAALAMNPGEEQVLEASADLRQQHADRKEQLLRKEYDYRTAAATPQRRSPALKYLPRRSST